MTIAIVIVTVVVSTLISIVVSSITSKIYILERKNRQLESKLDAIDRHVDRIDTRVYALENERKVKPKNKTDEK